MMPDLHVATILPTVEVKLRDKPVCPIIHLRLAAKNYVFRYEP